METFFKKKYIFFRKTTESFENNIFFRGPTNAGIYKKHIFKGPSDKRVFPEDQSIKKREFVKRYFSEVFLKEKKIK